MAITKYYKIIQPDHDAVYKTDNNQVGDQGLYGNYTWYHRLVQGSSSRLVKYREYDIMDNDIDVARSLDIIAEEMTGNNPKMKQPLLIKLIDEPDQNISSSTVITLKAALRTWCKIQEWDKRIFEVARNTVKYGDCFFIRPKKKNKKFKFTHPKFVVSAEVAQNDVTDIKGWHIKTDYYNPHGISTGNTVDHNVEHFSYEDVIRFSLNDEMSTEAPFGTSILRPVYTTFKQKELLEDAVLIYRIQRAPERRVFYVDVGRMPAHKVAGHLNQIKNEIKQKKIPTSFGGKSQVESVYNPQSMCLAMDTTIPLLDGRVLTLKEMIKEHDEGKENWIYSINPENGDVVPGIVSWAGVTRRDTETIKLTFDNGETLVCTPDHKIPVQGKGFVEAKDLTENDSLFPFHAKHEHMITPNGKKTTGKYTKIYHPMKKSWKYSHRLVANYMKKMNCENIMVHNSKYQECDKKTIHHIDYNSLNNVPNNLAFMNHLDHVEYHKSLNVNQIAKFSTPMKKRFIKITCEDIYISFKNLMYKLNNDEIFMGEYKKGNPLKKHSKLKLDTFRQKMFLRFIKEIGFKNWKSYQQYIIQEQIDVNSVISKINNNNECDIKLIQFLIDKIKNVSIRNFSLVNYFKDNSEEWNKMVDLYESSNIKSDRSLAGNYQNIQVPEAGFFERISKYFGYKSFKNLVEEAYNFNHRVVKIEKCINQDTGTLTIDGNEKYHNYHTFAVGNSSTGIYVRNSEDFFFAQRSDGSGSRVETLPGGTGLGELSDLEYFYKKMWRAMRIPNSYMSNTMEDGAVDNNGRVGIAYMQEIKFTLYIQRLQTYIERVMDQEFKRYLYDIGVHVDPTIYEVVLPEPSDYSKSRDQSINSDLLNNFSSASDESLSKRFTLKKYLGLTPDEIKENERLKAQELGLDPNADLQNLPKIYNPSEAELGGFEGGVQPNLGSDDIDGDTDFDGNSDDVDTPDTGTDTQDTEN